MVKVDKIIETALYCNDLNLSVNFYKELFGFEAMAENERLCAFDVNGKSILILFCRKESIKPIVTEGGVIPAHFGNGQLHIAFSISKEEVGRWGEKLLAFGVRIVSQVQWPLGGTSLYFYDPDQNLVELATPGLWKSY